MDYKELGFIVGGQGAESGAREINEIIKQEMEYDSPISTVKDAAQTGHTKGIDPIALGALLLSIPGTILAVMDIAARIKNKKKLDKVLERIQTQVVEKKNVTVKIKYPDGTIKEISSTESSEILDYFGGMGS